VIPEASVILNEVVILTNMGGQKMSTRYLKLFTLHVVVFALSLVVSTNSFAEHGDPKAGQTIYDVNCAVCHGEDGNSPLAAMGVPSFANGDRLDKPFVERYESVCKGKVSEAGIAMPPFCESLSEDDIHNAFAYEETLKE
jgi:mono/diheme cytochrome c family protein